MKTRFPHSGPRLHTGQLSSQVMLAHRTRGVMLACRAVCLFVTLACAPPDRGASNAASATQEAQDSVATVVISPDGGTVELERFATVIFPAGAFAFPQLVTVAATSSKLTQTEYELTADDAPRRPFEIRINTGAVGPRTEVEVVLPVTDAFLSSLPADHQVELWVQLFETGGQEVLDQFRMFSSDFDAQSKSVRAQLPTEVFTDRRRADESFEAILLVGSTPVGR